MKFPEDFTTAPGFDPAEDHIGPFYFLKVDDSDENAVIHQNLFAFEVASRHCNEFDSVHGGVLMTFADFALCRAAAEHYQVETCVTVSFACDFLAGASLGSLITCEPRVNKRTGSLAFVSGDLMVNDGIVFSFNSVVKRLPFK